MKTKVKTVASAAAAIAVAFGAVAPSLEAQAGKKPDVNVFSVIEDSTGKYFVGDSTQYIVVRDSAGNEIGVKPVDYRPPFPEGVKEEREVFGLILKYGESSGHYKRMVLAFPIDSLLADTCRYLAFDRVENLSPTGKIQKIPSDLDKLVIMVNGMNRVQVNDAGLNLSETEPGDVVPPETKQYLNLFLQHATQMGWRQQQPSTRYNGNR